MVNVVSGKEMKAIDGYSIQTLGIPSLVLMERAALAVAEAIESYCKAYYGDSKHRDYVYGDTFKHSEINRKKITILLICGYGNNGGDGIAVGRILSQKGYSITLCMVGNSQHITPETQTQMDISKALDLPFKSVDKAMENHWDIMVDGLFGIGLSRAVKAPFDQVIQWMNQESQEQGTKIWAVDIPSGIAADTGQVLGIGVKAFETITFGYLKLGLALHPGQDYSGNVKIADIGFPQKALEAVAPKVQACEPKDLKQLPKRPAHSNKGTFGKVLIIGGEKNMAGACYFSAKAAYNMGTGLVRVLTAKDNRTVLQTLLPEAIWAGWEGAACDKEHLLKHLNWADVIVIGPGLGQSKLAQTLLFQTLELARVPMIIDADALNLLQNQTHLLKNRVCPLVITPHLGEMARLTGHNIQHISENLIQVCEEFSHTYSVSCILKDSRTIICNPTGRCYINLSGNNGMAVGGSGDVLTGVVAGLIATKTTCDRAAELGPYIHGLAGDRAAALKGIAAMGPMDIIENLTEIMKVAE